jgi:hypothetical protein
MRKVEILLAILSSGCTESMADSKQPQVALALFEQFETVFSAKTDLFSGSKGYRNLSQQDANTLRVPFANLIGALDSLPDHASVGLFASADAVLVGARDFHPPAGLGGVRSRFCYIVVLENSTFELRKYFSQPPIASARGMTIWNWQVKLGEFGENDPRPSSLYATQVEQSYVLVSNDLEELQTIAKRLASPGRDSPDLSGIREWASVSPNDIWGYRRYRHTGIADRIAAGMRGVTPGAEALIFFPDFERNAGVLRLLNSPADERTAANLNATAKLPPFRSTGAGAWETLIPFSSGEKTLEWMIGAMGLFGFGLYL